MTNNIAAEKDMPTIVRDFDIFCKYIEDNKPTLTKTSEELGKKDCFAINALLSRPKDVDGPKYMQPAYPEINLFFHLAGKAALFIVAYTKNDKRFLVPTAKMEKYRALDSFSKYMFLFRIYWTMLDFNTFYTDSTIHYYLHYIDPVFAVLAGAEPEAVIAADIEYAGNKIDRENPIEIMFYGMGQIVHHLGYFGFWQYVRAETKGVYYTVKDIGIKSITPSRFGVAMVNACLERPFGIYNRASREKYLIIRNSFGKLIGDRELTLSRKQGNLQEKRRIFKPKGGPVNRPEREVFEQAFDGIFPPGAIDAEAIAGVLRREERQAAGNTYIFKVSLGKNIWRKIKLSSSHTLHQLHEAIQDAFGFFDDHLYAFFMDGKAWSKDAYWDSRGDEPPYTDEAEIGRIGLALWKRFLYLYDYGFEWRFDVRLEEILDSPTPPNEAAVIEVCGESPSQYPDWDDEF
jgi:hypothetical protein